MLSTSTPEITSEFQFQSVTEKYSKKHKRKHQDEHHRNGKSTSGYPNSSKNPFQNSTDSQADHSSKDLQIEMHSIVDLISQLQQNQLKLNEKKDTNVKMWKTSKETADYLATVAVAKSFLPLDKLVVLGIQAGIFVALGGCFALTLSQGVPTIASENPSLVKLLSGLAFPLALLLIVICGGELFTGNAMYFTSGIMSGKVKLRHLALNWTIVWLTNFVGCAFGAYLFGYLTDIFALDPWKTGIQHTAMLKVEELEIQVLFFRAIPANMLVCLAVYMSICADDIISKAVGIFVPITAFVTCGYEHCIANMFFVPLGLMYGAETTFGRFLYRNLIVTTLGNIIGGGLMVGALSFYLWCVGHHHHENQQLWKWSFFAKPQGSS
eukprot:CAMPEP_0168559874 /NCGR_PEP_ID=MMETSP0413-20121227/10756_1 /TAXON_ID=136452 /ORGANISM="Filamoeba nolandi, Strain NC-AS-23-1" /LENGTH=379 /DNA_ID=CAMNT_0008591131 /DNA_START=9 /DNA_END=1148 /DNA_ORIENTATION=-